MKKKLLITIPLLFVLCQCGSNKDFNDFIKNFKHKHGETFALSSDTYFYNSYHLKKNI